MTLIPSMFEIELLIWPLQIIRNFESILNYYHGGSWKSCFPLQVCVFGGGGEVSQDYCEGFFFFGEERSSPERAKPFRVSTHSGLSRKKHWSRVRLSQTTTGPKAQAPENMQEIGLKDPPPSGAGSREAFLCDTQPEETLASGPPH